MDEKKISTQSSRTRISISPTIDNWYYVEKEKVYTVIEYNDGLDSQTMVYDFEKHL